MKLAMSDVKQYALTQDIPVLQPQSFRDPAVVEELRALAPDVIACVAYGKILPQSVWRSRPWAASISTPASRRSCGAAAGPVGDPERGGGDGRHRHVHGPGDGRGRYHRNSPHPHRPGRKRPAAVRPPGKASARSFSPIPWPSCETESPSHAKKQDNSMATYAPMLTKALCPIDWGKTRRQICDHVRGLDPWPVATMELAGKRF